MVYFKVFPIASKTEITDGIKKINCLLYIINKQTYFLEKFNLLFSGYRLICISDYHK